MNKIALFLASILISLSFSGCAVLNLGKNMTKCEESGCDYSDAGVCTDPHYVLHNKQKVKKSAYSGIDCKQFSKGGL